MQSSGATGTCHISRSGCRMIFRAIWSRKMSLSWRSALWQEWSREQLASFFIRDCVKYFNALPHRVCSVITQVVFSSRSAAVESLAFYTLIRVEINTIHSLHMYRMYRKWMPRRFVSVLRTDELRKKSFRDLFVFETKIAKKYLLSTCIRVLHSQGVNQDNKGGGSGFSLAVEVD